MARSLQAGYLQPDDGKPTLRSIFDEGNLMRHVILTCKFHPNLRWSCKSIAFTPGQGYNNERSIFFDGAKDNPLAPECKCSPYDLILAPEEEERQKIDPTYDKEGRDIA